MLLAFGFVQKHWEIGHSSCIGNECGEFYGLRCGGFVEAGEDYGTLIEDSALDGDYFFFHFLQLRV